MFTTTNVHQSRHITRKHHVNINLIWLSCPSIHRSWSASQPDLGRTYSLLSWAWKSRAVAPDHGWSTHRGDTFSQINTILITTSISSNKASLVVLNLNHVTHLSGVSLYCLSWYSTQLLWKMWPQEMETTGGRRRLEESEVQQKPQSSWASNFSRDSVGASAIRCREDWQ